MSRAPLDLSGGRPTSDNELASTRELIARSGVVDVLGPLLDADVGRPRHLSLEGLLVVFQLNALAQGHRAHLVAAARVLNAFTGEQRCAVGIRRWNPDEAYVRVAWMTAKLCRVLDAGTPGVDASWFAVQIARAAIPDGFLTSRSVAVDGTDIETWGALHGSSRAVVCDGEAAETQLADDGTDPPVVAARKTRRAYTARVFGTGPDGRKRYTKDPDARAGHRSATNQRSAGAYVGYELHLAVQTRDVRWTNYIDKTALGDEVPGVITTWSLVPAGSHRAGSIVDHLIETSRGVRELDDVVWDPGYSLCQPQTTTYRLGPERIETTSQLVTHQRGIRPFVGEALLVDGQLYSRYLPVELRDLTMPPRGAKGAYRRAYEESFNRRARWRYVRHSRPDAQGVTRWKCPFCAGLLRSRQVPKTMRRSRTAPMVQLPADAAGCCHGTLSAPPAELPWAQKIPFGTTAWRISMNRRMVVESANAALKGGRVDMSRGFVRVFGLTKITFLFAFTIAAYNLDRLRSHLAKRQLDAAKPRQRPRRRVGTWADLAPACAGPVGNEDDTGPPG